MGIFRRSEWLRDAAATALEVAVPDRMLHCNVT